MGEPEVKRVVLPDDVVPLEYTLELVPDVVKFTFSGSVDIEVDVKKATKAVKLNSKELSVSMATVAPVGGKKQTVAEMSTHLESMVLTLTFDEEIPVGKAKLHIEFVGTLNDQLAGFYRSKYKDLSGKEKYMATTQFEAIDARRCFPCWDEPAVKAVFNVTLIVPDNLMALSNMPEKASVSLPGGLRRVEFLPSPKMSTYLLAFCIGEYDFVQGSTKEGTLVRCMSIPGKSADLAFALKVGIKSVEFYNDFFGIPYPLPKLDMIAIPDFAAGAMENWGLVTYREGDLIINPDKASVAQKQRVCTVVAHEIAHQWFGNLVTMEWWDNLWLNEGFANWMQTFTSDSIFPEWKIWESYVANEQANALSLDSLRSSHPIQVPIGKAETVEEVFDLISYCKGGSVVRMVLSVIGIDAFRSGLSNYLRKHSYANTVSEDLWAAWEEASKQPITELMNSWTLKMGYPVLTLTNPVRNDGKIAFDVAQSWFLSDGSQQEGDAEKTWVVPLLAGTAQGPKKVEFLKEKTGKMEVEAKGWVKLNYGQHVPLRVKYPKCMLEELAKGVKELSAEDRIGLLSDADALSRSGHGDLEDFVRIMNGYRGEANDKVWNQLSTALAGVRRTIAAASLPNVTELMERLDAFTLKLAQPCFESLGWDHKPDDSDNTKKLRAIIVAQICAVSKDPDVLKEAVARFEKYVADQTTPALHADIRGPVMRLLVKVAHPGIVETLKKIHNGSDNSPLRRDVYNALGGSKDRKVLDDMVLWSIGPDVKSQDLMFVLASASRAIIDGVRVGGLVMDAFIKANYDRVYELVGSSSVMLFGHSVKLSFSSLWTEEQLSSMEDFWRSKNLEKVAKILHQSVEGVRMTIKDAAAIAKSPLVTTAFWDSLQ